MKRILLPFLILLVFLFSCTPDIPDPVPPTSKEDEIAKAVLSLFENHLSSLEKSTVTNEQASTVSWNLAGPIKNITYQGSTLEKGNIDYKAQMTGTLKSEVTDPNGYEDFENYNAYLSVDFFFRVVVNNEKHAVSLIGSSSYNSDEVIGGSLPIKPLDYIFKVDGNRIEFDDYISYIIP